MAFNPAPQFEDFREKLSAQLRPWQRSFQFWARTAEIYTGYKIFQVRVSLVKDAKKQEQMWERQHELAADKIYNMCYDLGGFFLKLQLDLLKLLGNLTWPLLHAWVWRLVTLCDQAAPTPFEVVQLVLEKPDLAPAACRSIRWRFKEVCSSFQFQKDHSTLVIEGFKKVRQDKGKRTTLKQRRGR